MSIETLDDILEDILNRLDVFGHNHETGTSVEETCYDVNACRCCQKSIWESRIRQAMEVERKLETE